MEMEMEMEMRATEEIRQGEDMTSPLFPLASALDNCFLSTHCSTCFSPLPCCCGFSSLSLSSSELHLLHSSDLRAALRLLSLLPRSPSSSTCPPPPPPPPRLFGLLTNRDKLLSSSDSDIVSNIREGATEVSKARGNLSNDVAWEEAVLCLVMTNAVEVRDLKSGRILGIAVYDKNFSWINHSCSPNACYRFLLSEPNTASFCGEPKIQISPVKSTKRALSFFFQIFIVFQNFELRKLIIGTGKERC